MYVLAEDVVDAVCCYCFWRVKIVDKGTQGKGAKEGEEGWEGYRSMLGGCRLGCKGNKIRCSLGGG